jgi:iron complex outermembrane receptor protein
MFLLSRSIVSVCVIAAAIAPAQADVVEEGADIVVTAQRRAEPIGEVPVAITALSGELIARARLDDIKDLVTFTPGFSGNSDDSYIDALAIRGIVSNDYGIGGDPSIAIFRDGIYQGRTGSAVTSLYDVERAEALRGPQGFLFGRNAISGAISVISNRPRLDEWSGHAYASYGEVRRVEAETALNIPLGEGWAGRVAGYHASNDGWVDNAFTPGNDRLQDQNKTAARASLLHERGSVRVLLSADYERRRLTGTLYRATNDDREVIDALNAFTATPLVIRGGPNDIDSDLVKPFDRGRIWGGAAQVDIDLDFASLTSLTGYRGHRFAYAEDYDGTPLLLGNYTQRQRGSYLSQDLRLVSPDGGTVTWSAGLSAYRERVSARFTNEADEGLVCTASYGYSDCEALTRDLYGTGYSPASGGVLIDVNDARSINTGLSGFGDVNVKLAPRLQVGAGLRWSLDRKRFTLDILPSDSSLGNIYTFAYFTDGPISAARSWDGFTPRLFARYELGADLNAYASVTRGYKAGGFGSFTVDAPEEIEEFGLVPAGTRPDAFAPETIWSYEAGLKGKLGRLGFDVTGFRYVYRNLQTNFFDPVTRTQQVINVGRVYGHGVEASANWRPNRYLDLLGNLTYTRTRRTRERDCALRDCGGLPNPTWAASGIATGRYPLTTGNIFSTAELAYQGKRREGFDWRGLTRRDAYTEINLRLGFESDSGWAANLYVQNLTNARYYRGAENGGELLPANVWGVSQPRNVGVDLRWSWR